MKLSELRKSAIKSPNLTNGTLNLVRSLSEKEKCQLSNELQPHQPELEIQDDEHLNVQDKLKEIYEKFVNLYHTAPCGYVTVDKKGNIVEANSTFANQLGTDVVYLIDESFCHYIVNADKDIFSLHLKHIFNSETSQTCEVRLKVDENNEIWVRLDSIFVKIFKENGLCRTSIFDITKYRRTEDKLRLLSYAFDKCRTSIMITNREGNIEYVNSQFTRKTGYSAEEVHGKTPRIFKSGKQSLELYRKMWSTITSGHAWSGTFQNKKKNGSIFKELFSISPFRNSNGVITHFVKVTIE